jgi:hypothetical protein
VAGIWGARTWGFAVIDIFGVQLAVLFGMSVVPFVLLLLPVEARDVGGLVVGGLVVNRIVLALAALVQWKRPSCSSR